MSAWSRRVTFVDRLAPEAALDLCGRGSVRRFRKDEILFLQGERASRVAIVIDGVCKATAAASDGRSTLVGLRRAGDAIGLLGALDQGQRSSTVTALRPVVLRIMSLGEFRSFLGGQESSEVAVAMELASRVRASIEHRLESGRAVPVRLALTLLDLAEDHGSARCDGALVIDLPLTQDDLAMAICASRDSVAKTLMVWRHRRLVETTRRQIIILDIDGLRRFE